MDQGGNAEKEVFHVMESEAAQRLPFGNVGAEVPKLLSSGEK